MFFTSQRLVEHLMIYINDITWIVQNVNALLLIIQCYINCQHQLIKSCLFNAMALGPQRECTLMKT